MSTVVDADKMERVREKVEQMGVFFERSGLAPMTGRVFAYLLVCEPPHKDFFAIQEFLQASKSAVSNALTTLTSEGMVDYITFSGDRRRYFRINTAGWLNNLKNKLRRATVLGDLLDEVLKERCNSGSPDFSLELNKIVVFQNYLARGIEQLISDWDKKSSDQILEPK
jgi:predicted transcriptional regulator